MKDTIETTGIVTKVLGNNNYRVDINVDPADNPRSLLCYLGGKMRQFRINVIAGDTVTLEIPPPFEKGRITFRGVKSERATLSANKRQKKGPGRKRR